MLPCVVCQKDPNRSVQPSAIVLDGVAYCDEHTPPWAIPEIAQTLDAEEKIDHPAHYGGADDPYEAIKVIRAWRLGFELGNAIKYICRAGRKPGATELEDLSKALWYLQSRITELKGSK